MDIINNIPKKVQEFATENASTLLTAGAVVGTVATGVLAARAGIKAQQILAEAEIDKTIDEAQAEMEERGVPTTAAAHLSKMEKLALVGPQFIPPIIMGGATIGAVIFANRINAQRAAALAAAYGMSQKRLEEYKAKVEEKLTGPKNQQIKDEIAQDQVDGHPASKQVVIIAGGDALCFDTMSGRYFRSSMERIKRAEAELNNELFDTQMVSLSEFYQKIGLSPTGMSDLLGWTAFEDGFLQFEITTTTSDDSQPCFAITPSRTPEPNFHKIPGASG